MFCSFFYILSFLFRIVAAQPDCLAVPSCDYLCKHYFVCSDLSSASVGRRASISRRPVRMKIIFSIKKTMIVITIAFVSCISWLRSEIERSADMKSCRKCCQFFVSGFVGLLTYPFMCRQFSCTNALFQPSRGAMTALPMTGFHRAQISLHGKQYFRNTATLGILPCTPAFQIRGLQTIRQSSFRVRDSHPIPLFSEQECVSDSSGRAFATKAVLFSFLYTHA